MGLALKAELELNGAQSKFYAESMAIALSMHLLSRYSSRKPQIKQYNDGLPNYKLKEVIDYIQNNLSKKLTQAELSSLVHMSPHYFATLFKQSMGITSHQYVIKYGLKLYKSNFIALPFVILLVLAMALRFFAGRMEKKPAV